MRKRRQDKVNNKIRLKNEQVLKKNPLYNHPELITDPVFIVGNGTSRKGFDLSRLRGKGTIIGCNYLYRDFSPDILMMVNPDVILKTTEYCKENICITNNRLGKHIPIWKAQGANNSGGLAINLVSLLIQPEYCYMLGMDGTADNMYYGPKRGNLERIFTNNKISIYKSKYTIFVNVNVEDNWRLKTDKYAFMTYEEFEALYPNLAEGARLERVQCRFESD